MSYLLANTIINNLGKGLILNGMKPRQMIMVYAETRAEWMILAQVSSTRLWVFRTVSLGLEPRIVQS